MRLSLRYKVFFIILLANVLLAAAMLYANTRAFSTSFDTYLSQVQSRRLAPLLDALADEYQREGNWGWIEDHPDLWRALNERFLSPRHAREPRPRPEHRRLYRIFQLRDATGTLLWGDPRAERRTTWLPIEVDGQVIGSLGVPSSLRLTAEFDEVFAEQQRRHFLWIALVALLLSAVIAIPFAHALVTPIRRLGRATRQLADGHYNLRLEDQRSDELGDLASDFNRLAERLEANLKARQCWIADISHELRTPVAVLRAELEAIQDGISAVTSDTLESLYQEIRRLGSLIDDLHELSLSDAGALSYQMAPVNLSELIERVCAQCQSALRQAHLKLHWEAPSEPAFIEGDAKRLTQLLTNLMHNSLRYTQGDADSPGRVHITLQRHGDSWQLLWSDSAPGVPESDLPRLFERLYRSEHSRSRATGGSGIGLAIAHNVVTAHGGTIVANTSEWGGLQLVIHFPASTVKSNQAI
ncbi:ATP-binding protein [Marinimicrobium sp. ARAG 43.8]|uniref:ATP-binding protein n=1 Tax=Marinimicrobium sp. ARAG 43.8 TaxID=3418719 RepID=UPI003CF30AC3